MTVYAELVCRSNFSFLRGASHPEELVATAARLGMQALALTDADGLYGVVKAHLAAKEHGLKLLLGTELTLTDGPPVVVYAMDAAGYANLCRLVSASRMTHPKGEAGLPWRAVAERSEGLIALLPNPAPAEQVAPLAEAFPSASTWGVCRTLSAGDKAREAQAEALARTLGRAAVRAQRRAHAPPAPPAAAGRAHVHPPQDDGGQGGHAAAAQRRAHAEGSGGDGAAVPGSPRGAGALAGDRQPLPRHAG